MTYVYVSGCCSPNPGAGGYGVIIELNGEIKEFSKGFTSTTNNRMELQGIIDALNSLIEPCEVTVYSSSQYLVSGTKKLNPDNWKDDEINVKNADLWERLKKSIQKHTAVNFVWIGKNDGNKYKERCCELAKTAIAAYSQQNTQNGLC